MIYLFVTFVCLISPSGAANQIISIDEFFVKMRNTLRTGPLPNKYENADPNTDEDATDTEVDDFSDCKQNILKVATRDETFYVNDTDRVLFKDGNFLPKIHNKINAPNGENGTRLVGIYKDYGICLKQWPEIPNLELAFNLFTRHLFPGSNLTPEADVILINDQVFLVTAYVDGPTLSHYFEKTKDPLPYLNEISTFQLILASIIAMPEDGRPQNYILRKNNTIVSIDNDRGFGTEIVKDFKPEGNSDLMRVHSALFVLSQMQDPIPQELITRLIHVYNHFDFFFNKFNEESRSNNESLNKLFSREQKKEISKNHNALVYCFDLSVLKSRLLDRISIFEILARKKELNLNPLDFLNAVNCVVGDIYQKSFQENSSLHERYQKADGKLMEGISPKNFCLILELQTYSQNSDYNDSQNIYCNDIASIQLNIFYKKRKLNLENLRETITDSINSTPKRTALLRSSSITPSSPPEKQTKPLCLFRSTTYG